MVLATSSGGTFGIAAGAFVLVCLLAFVFQPRDLSGRRRATGCLAGLVIFFAAFLGVFVVWLVNDVF